MAGVTSYPFRKLCRQFGAGLAVSEMITARPVVEGTAKTLKLARFGPDEHPRSLQLYGIDPHFVGEAVRVLTGEGRVDHIDLNFGCPVRKVTSKGGGAALPLQPKLVRAIIAAAVAGSGGTPVTVKLRLGVDEEHLTYLTTGHIAQEEGSSAIGLHARTAAQLYSGTARWEAIGQLVQSVSIPVLGNGDIWEAADALRMVRTTGCHGVMVGRGCLGRPWLFRELAEAFTGNEPRAAPQFGEVCRIMLEHARLLADWLGEEAAMRSFRRHATWYTKGFRGSARLRQQLCRIAGLGELEAVLVGCDPLEPFPAAAARLPRGKSSARQRVSLPPGLLDPIDSRLP